MRAGNLSVLWLRDESGMRAMFTSRDATWKKSAGKHIMQLHFMIQILKIEKLKYTGDGQYGTRRQRAHRGFPRSSNQLAQASPFQQQPMHLSHLFNPNHPRESGHWSAERDVGQSVLEADQLHFVLWGFQPCEKLPSGLECYFCSNKTHRGIWYLWVCCSQPLRHNHACIPD